jgi:hypothetical protein
MHICDMEQGKLGKLVSTLSGSYDGVGVLVFSPDGDALVAGRGMHRFRTSAMFSPDARTLLSGATGGAALFLPAELLEAPSMAEIDAAEAL